MAKTEGWESIKDRRGQTVAIGRGEYVILKVELWSDMHYFAQHNGKLIGVCIDAERCRQLCVDHHLSQPIPEVDFPRTGSDQR